MSFWENSIDFFIKTVVTGELHRSDFLVIFSTPVVVLILTIIIFAGVG